MDTRRVCLDWSRFPKEGRLDVAVTRGHESDGGTEMTKTSWGQVQSGLSRQELLLLSRDRSRRTRGCPPLLGSSGHKLRDMETTSQTAAAGFCWLFRDSVPELFWVQKKQRESFGPDL